MSYFKNHRKYKIIIIFLVLLNVTMLSFLWVRFAFPPPLHPPIDHFVVRELGFDTQQRKVFHRLKQDFFPKTQKEHAQIRKLKHQLLALSIEEWSDELEQKSIKIAKNIASHQEKLEKMTFQHFREIRDICNPVQRQKFDQVLKEVLKRIEHRPQRK